jgi:hypothetical protein
VKSDGATNRRLSVGWSALHLLGWIANVERGELGNF